MKRFISGIIVGALLFGGASVFADSVGLIGQKVQGLFVIEKGGKKIADAVIIKGSAYAPVKAVADAAGANLTVEGKKIIMSDEGVNLSVPEFEYPNTEDIGKLNSEITILKNNITTYKSNIALSQTSIIPTLEDALKNAKEELAKDPTHTLGVEINEKKIADEKAYIAQQQALIDAAEGRIKELQAQIDATKQ